MSMNFASRDFYRTDTVEPEAIFGALWQCVDEWFPRLPWDSFHERHNLPGWPARWQAKKGANTVEMDHSDFAWIVGPDAAHDLEPIDVITYALGPDHDALEWVHREMPWLIHDLARNASGPAFKSAADLEDVPVPVRTWAVPDLVPDGTATLLSGDGGVGKSLLALQLAVSVASDTRWIGREVTPGPVVYLSAEDDAEELHRRLDGILFASRVEYLRVSDLYLRSTVGNGALLASKGRDGLTPSPLAIEIEDFARSVQARMIVLDTLANLYPGDENDRAQVTQFVDIVKGIAVRCGCAVVVLAHPSKSAMETGEGYSGSTAWNGAVRSRLYFERHKVQGELIDPDARVLRTMKANYGPSGGEIPLTYSQGVFVPAVTEGALDKRAATAKAERVFLELLAAITAQGRRVNHIGAHTYAPAVFADHPKSEGITRKAFKIAMENLLNDGRVRVSEDGPPSKRRQYLEVAE